MNVAAGRLLTPSQQVAWLRLIRAPNVGPRTFRQLVSRTGSAEAAIDALPTLAKRIGVSTTVPSVAEAERELAALHDLGGRLVAEGEPGYPPLLAHIYGAPPLLSVIGGERLDLRRTVAIVGARNASAAGKRMAELLARQLGERDFTVVSGLARGIDTAAHAASLTTGTLAVLAGGMDRVYPQENIALARRIIENGGMLITEMPLGWQPRAQDFPRRNRLVSGCSLGVVVVEAAKRSGSLITARLALEQDREVLAVPGSPLDPRSEGGNHLIQEGARLVTNADDIVEALGHVDPSRSLLLEPDWTADAAIDDSEPTDGDRARLLESMSVTPTSVDVLVTAAGLSVSTVQMLLLELDLAGRIEWSSGQLVALKP